MESYWGSNHMYRYNASLLLAVDCSIKRKGFQLNECRKERYDMGT